MVGTMRKDKRELPEEMIQCRKENEGEANFLYSNNFTLMAYCDKPPKIVVLLSSCGHGPNRNETSGRPRIVEDYNLNKSGVDMFNKLVKSRTCRRKTRRWPLRVFYFILDAAAYNAYILYRHRKSTTQVDFLKQLCIILVDQVLHKGTAKNSPA
jgi:hypothetical protein